MRLSFYPHGTLVDLRILLALVAVFFTALQVYSKRAAAERVLAVISITGSLVAALGIAQVITGAKGIYWTYPGGQIRSGPFVHYGHYAQFLNLSIAASLALFLLRATRRLGRVEFGVEELVHDLRTPGRGFDRWLAISIGVAIAAIGLSTSRNGILSLCIAGAVTIFAMQRARFVRGLAWPAIMMLLAATLTLFAFGFDPLIERLETLSNLEDASSTRFALLADTVSLWQSLPVFGAGLGAFEYSFPMFDTSSRPGTAAHAENQYAEVLADVGLVGFVLIAVVTFAVVRAIVFGARSRDGSRRASAYGIGFGILAVATHATTDFGLRTPPVAMAATLVCGLVTTMNSRSPSSERPTRRASASLAMIATVALVAALLVQTPGAHASWCAQAEWTRAENAGKAALKGRQIAKSDHFENIAAAAKRAAQSCPDNIDYAFWSIAYEWQSTVVRAHENEQDSESSDALPALASRSVPDLLTLRNIAPSYGQLWSMAGQLAQTYDGNAKGKDWIERGFRVAPHHTATCLAYADLGLNDDTIDEENAATRYRRALRMGASWQRVMNTLSTQANGVELIQLVARDNPKRLLTAARHLRKMELPEAEVQALEIAAREVWRSAEARGSKLSVQANTFLARAAHRDRDYATAIRYCRRALKSSYSNLVRIDLARALIANGERTEALRELRIAQRQHPKRQDIRRLIRDLSSR